MKPSAWSRTAGVLAGLPFAVTGLLVFGVDPVVRTVFSQRLGLVAMVVASLVAGWFAARFGRNYAPRSARGAALSAALGIGCGCLALLAVAAVYWVAAVIWFVNFSHFTW